ncbi:hypothetical protein ACVWXU_006410 [Streptomyces sp. TE33382]
MSVRAFLRGALSAVVRRVAPARRPPAPPAPFAELWRIESDPVYRARFHAGLDAAIEQRGRWRSGEVDAAIRRLRSSP